MTKTQRAQALKLLAAFHGDKDAERATCNYGFWLYHLTTQIEDELKED